MLFILIPLLWLMIAAAVLAVCMAAADGDAEPATIVDARIHRDGPALTAWEPVGAPLVAGRLRSRGAVPEGRRSRARRLAHSTH